MNMNGEIQTLTQGLYQDFHLEGFRRTITHGNTKREQIRHFKKCTFFLGDGQIYEAS